MIPLTRAISERIRGGLRRCAIQIDVYFTSFTLLYFVYYIEPAELATANSMISVSVICSLW